MRSNCLVFGVAVMVLGVAACSDDSSTSETAQPESTTTSVTAPTTTELPPQTTSESAMTTVAGDPAVAPAAWLAEQLAAGRSQVILANGDAPNPRLIEAYTPAQDDVRIGVLLDNNRVVPLPDDMVSSVGFSDTVAMLGERVALFARVSDHERVWLLDPTTLEWTEGPDLGLPALSGTFPTVGTVGDSILVGGVPTQAEVVPTGVMLTPDLQVTAIAAPPTPIPITWTNVVGDRAVLMGLDTAAGTIPPLRHPLSYDVASDTWTEIANPSWIACTQTETCNWTAPHEGGDVFLAATTTHGIVSLVPDGTTGLLDPESGIWRRLEDPPFALQSAVWVVTEADSIVVLPSLNPAYGSTIPFGTIATLDLTTGTWSTQQLDLAGEVDPSMGLNWDIRSNDTTTLVGVIDISGTSTLTATLAHDTATWQQPTESDNILWQQLQTSGTITPDLINAWT